jgi:hypothetical protein
MKKILVTGYIDSVFVSNLYSALKLKYKENIFFRFNVLSKQIATTDWEDRLYHFNNKPDFSFSERIKMPLLIPWRKIFKLLFDKIYFGSRNPITYLKFILTQIRYFYWAYYFEKKLLIQTVHFHTIILDYLWISFYFSSKVNIITTIWGSDLLRVSNPYIYTKLYSHLIRSNKITLVNENMKEFMLVKYGRDLENKVFLNSFILSPKIFDMIDVLGENIPKIQMIREKLCINKSKKIILIGHSGDSNDQHIKILEEFSIYDSAIFDDYTFVLPLSYGLTEDYKGKLLDFKNKSKLDIILQTEFLTFEDLAALKVAAKFVIMTPVSDANSAFLLESIYAGSKCIVGVWLPYGQMRVLGLPMCEVLNLSQIPSVILDDNKVSIDNKKVKKIIKDNYLSDKSLNRWNNILN